MNFKDIENSHSKFVAAKNQFDRDISDFVSEIAISLVAGIQARVFTEIPSMERLIPDPDISEVVNFFDSDYDNPVQYFEVKIPIKTAVRQLLDGKAKNAGLWLSVMRKMGYAEEGEDFISAIRRPKAAAFCMGLDDRTILYRDPAMNLERSKRYCPDYAEDYNSGHIMPEAELREMGFRPRPYDSFEGEFIHLFAAIEGDEIEFGAKLDRDRTFDGEEMGNAVYISPKPEHGPDILAEKILEKLVGPAHTPVPQEMDEMDDRSELSPGP